MPTKRTILAVGAVLSMVAGSQNYAYADATAKDMQVVARALGFLEKPPTGTVEIGIVVNPAQAEYVIPDVFVRRTEHGWVVEINQASPDRGPLQGDALAQAPKEGLAQAQSLHVPGRLRRSRHDP